MFITLFRKSILFAATATALMVGSFVTTRGDVVARAEAAAAGCASVPAHLVAVPMYTTTPFVGGMPGTEARSTDPVGPFPLSQLVPFPWATIEGIWTMVLPDGTPRYFSFEVRSSCDGRKFIQVVGFDQKTYRITAEGIGLGIGGDTMVRAVMTSTTSQYMAYIRQFRVGKATTKISTVVTIRPFNGDETDDIHMIARKASSLTLQKYIDKQREDQRRAAELERKYDESKRREGR